MDVIAPMKYATVTYGSFPYSVAKYMMLAKIIQKTETILYSYQRKVIAPSLIFVSHCCMFSMEVSRRSFLISPCQLPLSV